MCFCTFDYGCKDNLLILETLVGNYGNGNVRIIIVVWVNKYITSLGNIVYAYEIINYNHTCSVQFEGRNERV